MTHDPVSTLIRGFLFRYWSADTRRAWAVGRGRIAVAKAGGHHWTLCGREKFIHKRTRVYPQVEPFRRRFLGMAGGRYVYSGMHSACGRSILFR